MHTDASSDRRSGVWLKRKETYPDEAVSRTAADLKPPARGICCGVCGNSYIPFASLCPRGPDSSLRHRYHQIGVIRRSDWA